MHYFNKDLLEFVVNKMFHTCYRVTIVKDKETRKNKGVAFIMFLTRDDAHKCCHSVNNTEVHTTYCLALCIFSFFWHVPVLQRNCEPCSTAQLRRYMYFFFEQMFGRTLKCSIAKDNGRTTEFIKRKIYKDKSRCYECGVSMQKSYCDHK